MFKSRLILALAALTAATVGTATVAEAQVRSPYASQLRQNEARDEAREGRRLELSEVIRRVSAGREGRAVPGGVQARGDTYVVQWEYPGGRVVSIMVDARSGRILGER